MSEIQKPNDAPQYELFQTHESAVQFVDAVRENYRSHNAEYRGRRDEEQQIIAEVASDQADYLVDGVYLGLIGVFSQHSPHNSRENLTRFNQHTLQNVADNPLLSGQSWNDFKAEFRKLLAGFGVITNRLHRDGFGIENYGEMNEADQMRIASVLFSDFLKLNALRFGVDGSGLLRADRQKIYTEDGEIDHLVTFRDKDIARNDRELLQNVSRRGYREGVAQHTAAKMSPEEYQELRLEYPELAKDDFDAIVSSFINAEEELASRE